MQPSPLRSQLDPVALFSTRKPVDAQVVIKAALINAIDDLGKTGKQIREDEDFMAELTDKVG